MRKELITLTVAAIVIVVGLAGISATYGNRKLLNTVVEDNRARWQYLKEHNPQLDVHTEGNGRER